MKATKTAKEKPKPFIEQIEARLQDGANGTKYATCKRYGFNKHKVYEDHWQKLKSESSILGAGTNAIFAPNVFDEQGLKSVLLGLRGNPETGKFLNPEDGLYHDAELTHVKKQIEALGKQWRNYQQERINLGHARPTIMPQQIENEKFRLEARLDILTAAIAKVENRLEVIEMRKETVRGIDVLRYGLQERCKLTNGLVSMIDGQKVRELDGRLIIDDQCSPYNGMAVSDYRNLAKAWKAERLQRYHTAKAQYKKELKANGHSKIKVSFPAGTCTVSKESLPKWPNGVKNHKELQV